MINYNLVVYIGILFIVSTVIFKYFEKSLIISKNILKNQCRASLVVFLCDFRYGDDCFFFGCFHFFVFFEVKP